MTVSERQARFYEAWRESTAKATPQLDVVKARARLVARRDELERQRTRVRFTQLGVSLVAACAIAALVARASFRHATTFTIAGQRGEVGEWLATSGAEELRLSFSEGTQVALEAGSRGRVENVSADGAYVTVERGTVRAQVKHRDGAAWRFGAGPFDVQVTGTSLAVNWDPDGGQFSVDVLRGSVLVRGPHIASAQEVRAGERCKVDLHARTMELVQVVAAAAPGPELAPAAAASEAELGATEMATPPTTEAPMRSARTGSSGAGKSWLTLAQNGHNAEAVDAATRSGLGRIYQSAGAEDLIELARAARLIGRADIERDALMACRRRFAGHPAGARAAYLLGRSAVVANDAARWFETYLEEQPSGVLAREAAGRIIESYQRLGNRARARDAASRYLATYGDGPHASLARQVLSSSRGDGG